MKHQSNFKHVMQNLCIILLGNALYALTAAVFLIPSGLVTGGTTGIALALHEGFHLSISAVVLTFNLFMLLLGFLLLGKKFAFTTIISTFAYPIFLELFQTLLKGTILTNDIFLNTIFSGLGIGISLGLVIRTGASTGGMDIPPLILKKYFNIPVSLSLYLFDFIILLFQAHFSNTEKLLYGVVLVLTYSITLDKLLLLGNSKTQVKIISQCPHDICNAILEEVDRGVTILHGEGGYLHKNSQILLSVVSNRELPHLQRIILDIDPESFIIISRVTEVRGRGFSINKKYR